MPLPPSSSLTYKLKTNITFQNPIPKPWFFFVYQVCLFIKIVNEHLRLVNLIKLKDLTIFKKWYHCETLVIVSTLGPSGSGEWRMLVIFVEQWPNFKNKMPKKMLYFSVPNSGCRSCCIVYKNDFFWVETWRYSIGIKDWNCLFIKFWVWLVSLH